MVTKSAYSFSKTKLETDIQRKEMRSLNLHLPKQNLFHYSKNFLFSEKWKSLSRSGNVKLEKEGWRNLSKLILKAVYQARRLKKNCVALQKNDKHLQCDYSKQGPPTKFSTNLTNKIRGG